MKRHAGWGGIRISSYTSLTTRDRFLFIKSVPSKDNEVVWSFDHVTCYWNYHQPSPSVTGRPLWNQANRIHPFPQFFHHSKPPLYRTPSAQTFYALWITQPRGCFPSSLVWGEDVGENLVQMDHQVQSLPRLIRWRELNVTDTFQETIKLTNIYFCRSLTQSQEPWLSE